LGWTVALRQWKGVAVALLPARLELLELLVRVAARVTEMVTRIKVALPSCYPHQTSWARLAARAAKLPPLRRGEACPIELGRDRSGWGLRRRGGAPRTAPRHTFRIIIHFTMVNYPS
jgi:hypothetical protein